MAIGRDVPANAGVYRPVCIVAPPGTVVNAVSPAPVANQHDIAPTTALLNRIREQVQRVFLGPLNPKYKDISDISAREIFFSHRDIERICELLEGWYGVAPPPVDPWSEDVAATPIDDKIARAVEVESVVQTLVPLDQGYVGRG